jgi:hypothetical protein
MGDGMNMKGYVGWGFYGAATSGQRANMWASWGLRTSLSQGVVRRAENFIMRIWGFFK